MMEEYIQVFTTTDSEENANEIAKIVLSKKLAGCTQIIGPIVSSYTPLYYA
ncbi:MAG: divalent cation tolerance protein CutA [Caldisericia bacterium]|jgi:periplasmic divalent cation tolerance protein|nr:divalent cation tolerance protein CutA [Caldisericia bacterium]